MFMNPEKMPELYEALCVEISNTLDNLSTLRTQTVDEEALVRWVIREIESRPDHCAGCIGEHLLVLCQMLMLVPKMFSGVDRVYPIVRDEIHRMSEASVRRVFTDEEIEEGRNRLKFMQMMQAGGNVGNPYN
jgi:hypothetical protein